MYILNECIIKEGAIFFTLMIKTVISVLFTIAIENLSKKQILVFYGYNTTNHRQQPVW